MPHRFVEERPNSGERAAAGSAKSQSSRGRGGRVEPLADLQWDMAAIGANADGAWRRATGRRVQVGVIDTGIDASHPDIAPNFNAALSRNFTMDIPSVDGPCEVATCIDPANVDDGGHGTHVAGIIAAARNGIGIAGVAPDAELVNVRAGQDSGFFFLFETVQALTYAGDAGLDVVNMSFYTDPWLFNCDSRRRLPRWSRDRRGTRRAGVHSPDDHGRPRVRPQQGRHARGRRRQRPHRLLAPHPVRRHEPRLPGAPEAPRTVTNDCLDLPSEGPHVIAVGSTGPSGTKSDFSNYGLGSIDLAAPGGWFRDGVGTPTFGTPGEPDPVVVPVARRDRGRACQSGRFSRRCVLKGVLRLAG